MNAPDLTPAEAARLRAALPAPHEVAELSADEQHRSAEARAKQLLESPTK